MKVKLTEKEKGFCEIMQTGFIARNKDKELRWHLNYPIQETYCGAWEAHIGRDLQLKISNDCFHFLKWKDEEPFDIEAYLELREEYEHE